MTRDLIKKVISLTVDFLDVASLGKPGVHLPTGRELKVEIMDQGPGLSQKDLVSLFTPFYRGEAGKGVEGSGLGLAAVKAIVEAHGGTIVAGNRPEGDACFRITLPADAGD